MKNGDILNLWLKKETGRKFFTDHVIKGGGVCFLFSPNNTHTQQHTIWERVRESKRRRKTRRREEGRLEFGYQIEVNNLTFSNPKID